MAKKTTLKAKKVEIPTKTRTLTIRLDVDDTAELDKVMKYFGDGHAQRSIEKLIREFRSDKRTLGDIQMQFNEVSNKYETLVDLMKKRHEIDAEIKDILISN
jgi:2-hydroxy-3-keto-5-methylthiopentenyl-1-phosphate phosphatase